MRRLVSFLVAIIASFVLSAALLAITGYFGEVPCGEDGWRWGLAQAFIEVPVLAIGLVFGVISACYKAIPWRRRIMLLGIQSAVSVLVVIAILWPNVIYVRPECL